MWFAFVYWIKFLFVRSETLNIMCNMQVVILEETSPLEKEDKMKNRYPQPQPMINRRPLLPSNNVNHKAPHWRGGCHYWSIGTIFAYFARFSDFDLDGVWVVA